MPYKISYPERYRDEAACIEALENPDNYVMPTEKRDRWGGGLRFDKILRFLLEPDQLEWTQGEITAAADGIEKVVRMAIPSADLDVLRKYDALVLPNEVKSMGRDIVYGPMTVAIDGKFKAPFDQLSTLARFRVPLAWASGDTRPKSALGEAFAQQLERLNSAIDNHSERLDQRVKDFMFGRPIETSRQRVLSHMIETYPEFDWLDQIMPYIKLNLRKTGSQTNEQ